MPINTRKLLLRSALVALALLSAACEKQRPAYALTSTGRILGFDIAKPTKIKTEARVTGLRADESLVQIAFRPGNATFYGLTNRLRICTLDPKTGAASLIGTASFTTETLVSPTIDFNPVADRLRVIANEQNLRVNPDSGGLEATDTSVFFDNDDVNDNRTPQLAALAYDRNMSGSSASTLFALDVTTQSLVRVGSRNGAPDSPNGGKLFTVARLGTGFTGFAGFDIEPDGDTAYAALAASGSTAALYRIDLKDGSADRVDSIGKSDSDRSIISLAVGPEDRGGSN